MARDVFRDALILTGPTGSGKSGLAVELAERLDAEIVSMDSMALYRGMDIGTAKAGPDERRRVRHHLIDVLDPWESASVAWWLEQAASCCREIAGRGKRVLFVGGTPLYLKSLLRGMFAGPARDEELRARLLKEAESLGTQVLHDRLRRADPLTAGRVHVNDVRRVIRALEVLELTGTPISSLQQQWHGADGQLPVSCWLDVPRQTLYTRINERTRYMFTSGLVDEVRALQDLPRPLSREARQALGYKEILAHLAGAATLEDTIAEVQTRTRQFAKRQVSWFRHLPEVRPSAPELTAVLRAFTIRES